MGTPSSTPIRLLAGDLYELSGFASGDARLQYFATNGQQSLERLIQHLLFYDEVCVAAEDLLFLAPMCKRFPRGILQEIFHRGLIRVVHVHGKPVFGAPTTEQESPGDFAVMVNATRTQRHAGSGTAFDAEIRRFELGMRNAGLKSIDGTALRRNVIEVDLSSNAGQVCDRLRSWLAGDSDLAKWAGFSLQNGVLVGPNVAPRTICATTPSTFQLDRHVDRCVSLVQAFAMGWMSRKLGIIDTSTTSVACEAQQVLGGGSSTHQPTLVLESAGIPDIAAAVFQRPEYLRELIRLRDQRSASDFRKWFHVECAGQPRAEVMKAIGDMLQAEPWLSGHAGRILRFLVGTVIGAVASPVVGVVASAVDGLVVDEAVNKLQPKRFLADASQWLSRKQLEENVRGDESVLFEPVSED